MQISDELLVRLETAINTVMDDAEVDYPIGYHKGMHRVSWDAAEMRRALAAALSLPVQPVAWPEGFFKLGGDNRLRECASDGCHQHVSIRVERSGVGSDHCEPCARKIADLLTTPPISPTKGPEDDLIAAREAAEDIEINYVVCDPKEVREQVAAAIMDALRKDRALRSRPASALPVVGEDGLSFDAMFQAVEAVTFMGQTSADPLDDMVNRTTAAMKAYRAALIPSVQP